MAEYPWGAQAPSKRVSSIESQIAVNDKRRAECVDAHKKKLVEFDDADRKLRSDLRQATQIVEREDREATVAAAAKAFERMMSTMTGQGVDVGALVRSGEFEKLLGKAVSEAGTKGKAARKPAEKPAGSAEEPAAEA
jgi:hypothetical protein